jgi:hypothetical protein
VAGRALAFFARWLAGGRVAEPVSCVTRYTRRSRCDPTDIVAAEDVNAELCGCGALFLRSPNETPILIPTGAEVNR